MTVPWWKTAVVYQIYPRSFLDTDGDGIGDLPGIRRRLDHLVWLGVDAIWLSPFYRSPMADFGYDVSDHTDVDPIFGNLAEIEGLVADAHARGIRVIVDVVPNHTSDRHPWFLDARSSRDAAKRHWYVWRDPAPGGGPPNNWVAAFPPHPPAWTLDPASGQYYLHSFLPAQPDLDWGHPAVVEAMHDVMRFWLARGVDGFRLDVVHLIGKDPALADDPPSVAGLPHVVLNHRSETHLLLRDLRRLVEEYPGERMLVGEVYLLDTTQVASYYGRGDELHLAFNFPPLYAPWDAAAWRAQILAAAAAHDPIGAWPTWVLSNHDNRRHRSRYGSEARARAAAVLLLTLRGTPFLFQGEELGLEDAAVPPARRVDPGGRDGCRAPIPWDGTPTHGWPTAAPWLPWPPDAEQRNVAAQRGDGGAILGLYRRLLALRKTTPALRSGALALLEAPDGVLAYERSLGSERLLVLVSFSEAPVRMAGIQGTIALRSSGAGDGEGEGSPFSGLLAPDEAVVLRP